MEKIDFGYLSMDEIKLMAVEDRLKKFEGNQTRAADSLQIHVNSVANILNRATNKPETTAQKTTAQERSDFIKNQKEGFKTDPNTGLSVPQPVAAVPGIENIAKETFENGKRKQEQREKEEKARASAAQSPAAVSAPKPGTPTSKRK